MVPVLRLVQKEFRQIFRDRMMVRMIFLMPLIQLLVLSYAANLDLERVRIGVLDYDHSPASRRLVEAFHAAEPFETAAHASGEEGLERLLVRGRIDLALRIPRGYQRDLQAPCGAVVALTVDGQNSMLAGQAAGHARGVLQRVARREARLRGWDLAAVDGGIELVTRFFYNPELKSRRNIVPGIVVLLLTVLSAMLTSMAVVREKELGTLEQLMVTPLSARQILAGKTLPFAALAFGELAFATVVAVLWFRLPLTGSIGLLASGMLLYLLVTLGIGLLASTVSRTQQQAMFTVWFFLVFGILLSGFFVPVENMPDWLRWLTRLNPMRYSMEIVRAVFLKGAGFADAITQLEALLVLGVGVFGLAVLRFRKRMT